MDVHGRARMSLKKIIRLGIASPVIIIDKSRRLRICRKEKYKGAIIIGKGGRCRNHWKSKMHRREQFSLINNNQIIIDIIKL